MGNNLSESSPLYISDALNWRTGAISEPVPAPVDQSKAITTYEQLGLCCEFKEYMLKHIDLDNLISSVLSSAEDQEQLLKGIDKFKAADPDLADDLQQLIENFEQCVSAGINVSILIKVILLIIALV